MAGSLQDIADALHVSISLVSKVLSGKLGTTGVSPETVEAIRRHARSIGYVKNSAAAGLATGRQNTLGVYVHHYGVHGSGLTESLVMGIAEQARANQQRLLLTYFPNVMEFDELTAEVTPNAMDGIIAAGVWHKEIGPTLAKIRRQGVQVVTVMDKPVHVKVPNIGMSQALVAHIGTTHLLEQGCRNVASIYVFDDRYIGYKQALEMAGIPFRPELTFHSPDFTAEGGRLAIEHFLASGVAFDGVFAASDQLAAGAMYALLRAGQRVPDDVKIVGVDNSPFCEFCIVPLTSVSQQERVRGAAAVGLLLAQVSDRPKDTPLYPPVLHVRDSSRR